MTERHPHHRPRFHISPPRGYLNDPNGPVELNGVLHLYYQSRSLAHMAAPVEWGHATTTDLVNWTLHRPAFGPVPGGLDSDGCFSGNTVVEGDRIRAYYSGYIEGRQLQHTLTALSNESGASFGSPALVVADPHPDERVWMLRDPFVWREGDDWTMVTGAGVHGGLAAIRRYRSSDGLDWRFAGNLAELRRTMIDGTDTGEAWECPQIIRLADREVALVCSWSLAEGPVGGVVAFPLDTSPHPRPVDDGHEFYAPSVLRESSHGPLLFGWIPEGRESEWWQEEGWSGAISLPRRAWLATETSDTERLCTEPHPAVKGLRLGNPLPANGSHLGAQAEIIVPTVTGRVRLRFGNNEWFDIDLDTAFGTVTIDRSHASIDARAKGGRAFTTDAFDITSERPALRIFLDGSTVEIFTSAGRSLTTRVYPIAQPPWQIEAPDGSVVWELASSVAPA